MSNIEDNRSLVDVFLGKYLQKSKNPIDVVTLDVPLFIRLLEFAREDAKDDMALHSVTSRLLRICADGDVANMSHYARIVK